MVIALTITIAAALAMLAIPVGLYLARRRAKSGKLTLSTWSFRPNPILLTILALGLAAVLWRFFPGIIFLPLLIPFFWRFRGRGGQNRPPGTGGPFIWQWRVRRDPPPSPGNGHANGHAKDDERPIEGQFRNLDDE